MNYWWVNQNQTYVHEVRGGYLWSPKTNKNGARNRFYDAMTEVVPGDVIFSFMDTYIKAIGIVSGSHQSASKPTEFGTAGANWTNEGWYVPAQFHELSRPIKPKDHMPRLRPLLPQTYSPLQTSGNGNQGVYLTPLPAELAQELVNLLEGQVETILAKTSNSGEANDNAAIAHVLSDDTEPATQRTQLIQARIGQGLFRSRVAEIELACRVTGLDDARFLIASHIKPWSQSDNREKLDGQNGLLLAPHIDHLFDKGYITFDDNGRVSLSKHLPDSVLKSWRLIDGVTSKPLTEPQRKYMAYHRAQVFRN